MPSGENLTRTTYLPLSTKRATTVSADGSPARSGREMTTCPLMSPHAQSIESTAGNPPTRPASGTQDRNAARMAGSVSSARSGGGSREQRRGGGGGGGGGGPGLMSRQRTEPFRGSDRQSGSDPATPVRSVSASVRSTAPDSTHEGCAGAGRQPVSARPVRCGAVAGGAGLGGPVRCALGARRAGRPG